MSSQNEKKQGLSRSDTIHLYNELQKIREFMTRDQEKIKSQENEIKKLKEIIKEKDRLLNNFTPEQRLIASAMVTPQNFRNQVESKLLAIREEVLKLQTERESLIVEAPLEKERRSSFNSSELRRRSKNIPPVKIYLDGCWDVMHSGHYNALRQAKALGDYLIVGVHSDEEIKRNKRKPVMKNEERLYMVKACKWADEIVFDVPYSPTNELLDSVGADYCAHGDDIPLNENGESAYGEVTPRLKIFKRTPGVSTTALIQRLLLATQSNNKNNKNNIINNKINNIDSNDQTQSHSAWTQFLPTSHRISAFSNHRVPSKDDKVVYIDGDWDLFHCGHIKAIEEAKKLGTFLYVGLYDDNLIKSIKGSHWPMMSLQERILNVLSCKYVNEVIVGSQWILSDHLIKTLNISKIVNCKNTSISSNSKLRYAQGYKKNIVYELNLDKNILTTDILVQRMIDDHKYYKNINKDRIQREKNYEKEKQYIQEN